MSSLRTDVLTTTGREPGARAPCRPARGREPGSVQTCPAAPPRPRGLLPESQGPLPPLRGGAGRGADQILRGNERDCPRGQPCSVVLSPSRGTEREEHACSQEPMETFPPGSNTREMKRGQLRISCQLR